MVSAAIRDRSETTSLANNLSIGECLYIHYSYVVSTILTMLAVVGWDEGREGAGFNSCGT